MWNVSARYPGSSSPAVSRHPLGRRSQLRYNQYILNTTRCSPVISNLHTRAPCDCSRNECTKTYHLPFNWLSAVGHNNSGLTGTCCWPRSTPASLFNNLYHLFPFKCLFLWLSYKQEPLYSVCLKKILLRFWKVLEGTSNT